MDTKKLWEDRFQAYLRVFLGYMRLIGNSGFLFSIFFLILFGSYYYSVLIKQIPETFPLTPILAVILSYFLVKSPIRTFLKRADLVFLIAAEERMKTYFTASVIYNIALQSFVLLLVAVVLAPLYSVQADDTSYPYIALLILFLMVKAWNISVNWFLMKLQSKGDLARYMILRAAATFILVFLALEGASGVFLLIIALIMLIFLLYISHMVTQDHGVKWERLIEMDETLLIRFYRIANAFTDVPRLKQRVRPRRWLDWLTKAIPYKQSTVFLFLYTKAFLRAGDSFGIYIRLLVLGAIVLFFIPNGYGQLIGFLLFLYLSAVQLVTFFHHFAGHEMVKLYPISKMAANRSFQQLLLFLLIFKSIVYAFVLLISGSALVTTVILLAVGILLSYGYVGITLKNKMKGARV